MILCSPVKAIDSLSFRPIPLNRALKGCTTIKIAYRSITIVKTATGVLYQDGLGEFAYGASCEWPWMDAILKALIKLELITKDDAEKHKEYAKAAANKRNQREEAKRLKEVLARNKLQLSKQQEDCVAASH